MNIIDKAVTGQLGVNISLNSSSSATASGVKYFAIQFFEPTVLNTAITKDKGTLLNAINSVFDSYEFGAGWIYGDFSEIKLVSGVARAYASPFQNS